MYIMLLLVIDECILKHHHYVALEFGSGFDRILSRLVFDAFPNRCQVHRSFHNLGIAIGDRIGDGLLK